MTALTRRSLLIAGGTALAAAPLLRGTDADSGFAALESRYGARLGVVAIDTHTHRSVRWRADERIAYCSTYKALAGGVLLRRGLSLERVVHYSADDLVDYSPVTSQHVATGMTLWDIAEAAIRQSDNTAGNLLFRELGGPRRVQAELRRIGDRTTRMDRIETALNAAVPKDGRDTSTPRALATDLCALLVDGRLSNADAGTLMDWMSGNATGDPLIRAGLPAGWSVADKSGAGSYGTRNDIGLVTRPHGAPIAIAILSTKSAKDAAYDNALIADAARLALAPFAR